MKDQVEVPKPFSTLIDAQNRQDSQDFTRNFTLHAHVRDESKDYFGHAAIRAWNQSTNEKYHTHLRPLQLTKKGRKWEMKVEVSGTFDGSPIALNYYLELEDGKISDLDIRG
ncbi:MAG: hypothetical protein C5B59_16575 [Bacteroidetes bacterium]|nr:MAG: hypothetical protein C5B59_16575 [Bacteroidota bacterium]